jgi:adenine-specific DNA-methyltransferase
MILLDTNLLGRMTDSLDPQCAATRRAVQRLGAEHERLVQLSLWPDDREDAAYLQEQLITYIGNKRALLKPIGAAVATVQQRLGKKRLRILDAFSGSGIIARFCKAHADYLAANDLEPYAALVARCYLRNRSAVDLNRLGRLADDLNRKVDSVPLAPGFIEALYSPKDENNIQDGERVFYTRANARRLDNYRRLLDDLPADERLMLMGPLLHKASVHANTSGVFKGFYKDRHSNVGKFGGSNGDALTRIKGEIRLAAPILSRFECAVDVFQEDANELVKRLRGFDLAYFDPPYNQHPYGSNYFMLNLLVDYRAPTQISKVSGIPVDWQRSDYNVRARSFTKFAQLARDVDAKFLLVSFNDEGFIEPDDMRRLLEKLGTVDSMKLPYNTFRGSRNLRERTIHVTEYLFLVERR